jgi:hypothetical protein
MHSLISTSNYSTTANMSAEVFSMFSNIYSKQLSIPRAGRDQSSRNPYRWSPSRGTVEDDESASASLFWSPPTKLLLLLLLSCCLTQISEWYV